VCVSFDFPAVITSTTQRTCRWNFIGTAGYQYQFRLMYFDIPGSPSCSNKLMVYDGVITGFSPIMGKLWGDISTFTFQPTSSTMSVVLKTNTASSGAFKGIYGVIERVAA